MIILCFFSTYTMVAPYFLSSTMPLSCVLDMIACFLTSAMTMPFTNIMFLPLFVLWQYQVFDFNHLVLFAPWQLHNVFLYSGNTMFFLMCNTMFLTSIMTSLCFFFHLHNCNTLFLTFDYGNTVFFGYGTMVIPCFVHVILPRAVLFF